MDLEVSVVLQKEDTKQVSAQEVLNNCGGLESVS